MRTFHVRGRPVGFRAGRFGGELVAVERGYFPISPTGYRSLSGAYQGEDDTAPEVPAEVLESLAANQDKERRSVLGRVQRAPRLEADPLSNYIGASGDAERALAEGFFAPEAERVALWCGAFARLSLINADPRFQPTNSAPVWTPDYCARALAAHRALLAFVRGLAAGVWPAVAPARPFGLSAYFELPPKLDGEPGFALPSVTSEFALDLPPALPDEDDEESTPSDGDAPDDDTDQPPSAEQLALF